MKLITLGFVFVLIGILLIMASLLSMVYHAARTGESELRGGGIVMIGPIPIIFGTDVGALKAVMILAILLMIIAITLVVITRYVI